MMRNRFVMAVVFAALALARTASADTLGIGFITCIAPSSCPEATGPVYWRILNGLSEFANPDGGSEDLLDVTLDFQFEGGSLSWHWDRVPAWDTGVLTETDPFAASLVSRLTLLRFEASLPRTLFSPLYPFDDRVSFIASTNRVTASATTFPPPINFFAEGQYEIAPVPDPATLTLVATGLSGLIYRRRRVRTARLR